MNFQGFVLLLDGSVVIINLLGNLSHRLKMLLQFFLFLLKVVLVILLFLHFLLAKLFNSLTSLIIASNKNRLSLPSEELDEFLLSLFHLLKQVSVLIVDLLDIFGSGSFH